MLLPFISLSNINPTQSRRGIATNQIIVIGSLSYDIFWEQYIALHATQKPIKLDPLSPRNTPLFFPNIVKLFSVFSITTLSNPSVNWVSLLWIRLSALTIDAVSDTTTFPTATISSTAF